jgi:hypothetical protein
LVSGVREGHELRTLGTEDNEEQRNRRYGTMKDLIICAFHKILLR